VIAPASRDGSVIALAARDGRVPGDAGVADPARPRRVPSAVRGAVGVGG
jgi:hypothetical protein